jgi:hypothetical protein
MASPYRRIGVNSANPTLLEVNADVERLKRRLFWVHLLLLLLLLLLLGAIVGYAVGLWVAIRNTNDQQTVINGIQGNVTSAQSSLLQLIVEEHGNVTVLQSGTVSWTLSTILPSGPNPSCVTETDYINQGGGGMGSLISGTYQLQNVQIGALNWTMLVLSPPSETLIYTYPSDNSVLIQVCVVFFTPTVPILDTINTDAPLNVPPVLEFTAPNLARLTSTPDCLVGGTCFISPYFQEWYTGSGAYSIQQATSFPNAGEFFLQWVYQYTGDPPALGTNFTISEPLQLMLPSS